MASKSIRIPQIDCKDIYLSNNPIDEAGIGYRIRDKNGRFNIKRFRAALDYSLEVIKLREIYFREYGRTDFSQRICGHDYTKNVVSVTFKYSVRTYNRVSSDVFIRHDKNIADADFKDCVWIENGEMMGICTNRPVETPVAADILGKYFEYRDGRYWQCGNPPSLIGVAELRDWVYMNGFYMDGVHFVRYKRSSGSSRVGKCLFIDEKLLYRIQKWEMCGLTIADGDECDLAAIESYISLTMSSIIGTIEINPQSILLIDDYESVFKDDVVVVKDVDGHLIAEDATMDVSNNIWDGQSLIDRSIMGEFSDYGFILLRNNFFKSAAFNCNIQKWFADNGVTSVSQLNGTTLADDISQIKLITTPSSIKYLKFGEFGRWLSNITPVFGVVKHEKKTHYWGGRKVKTHYQLLNSIQMTQEDVREFMAPSLDYLNKIKTDVAVFRKHINFMNTSFDYNSAKSKCDVAYKLLGITDEFANTKLFKDFRRDAIHSFVTDMRLGHILVDGNYSVMVGNPIEMLESAIGQFEGKSQVGIGCIHSRRFDYDKTILGSRSPQPASGNLLITRNVANETVDKYMNLTNEICVVNSIDENLLNRLSGADFDSDSLLLTDDPVLVRVAEKNYSRFKVPTGDISAKKIKRRYTNKDKAALDVGCKSTAIGQIINLSQELNTLMWDVVNTTGDWYTAMDIYKDVAMLSVLSGVAIDSAKKEFSIDCIGEMKRVKDRYVRKAIDGRQIKPNFFATVSRKKGYYDTSKKVYRFHHTTMDYIQKCLNSARLRSQPKGKDATFESIVRRDCMTGKVDHEMVNMVLAYVRQTNTAIKEVWATSEENMTMEDKHEKVDELYQGCINFVDDIKMSQATMRCLLIELDNAKNSDIRRRLWGILFGQPNMCFYGMLKASKTPIGIVEECPSVGADTYMLYGIPHRTIYQNLA